ncbi:MAG: alpha-glucosidase [Clostridia bacterium]|nr:alpha-glucosidase [Clostridia bacterium]
MIRRYDFGQPYETGAVVRQLPVCTEPMPHFTVRQEGAHVRFSVPLGKDDMIFGLGQSVRGLNKRGHRYRAWNSDDFSHTEDKASLYGSHNLLLFTGENGVFGAYFDDPGAVEFDLGYTRSSEAVITSENGDLTVYVIDGGSLTGLVREFRQLIGKPYLPPKWGMGYIQSRWGYATERDLRAVIDGHRERHIPLDTVSMDIDYMDDYKDFTWDPAKFPNLKAMTEDFRRRHIRVMPIIDAGVKVEPGDPTYDEGLKNGYFCRKENGDVFMGAVWPGRAVFPDFLREEVRAWFGQCYRPMLEAGVEAIWNDMNEPAIFYSDEGLEAAYRKAEELRETNIGVNEYFSLKDAFTGMSNSMADYRRFCHVIDGKPVRHDKVHNLYGAMMTKASALGMRAARPGKRPLLFSRSSFVGAHRDGGIWQGDNNAWWGHILLNLRELASLNMVGFLFNGADIGGFGCNTTEDLLLRWLQLGVFTPIMRNHAAMGTRDQEIYRFESWETMRDVLRVRYALLPYLYSELVKAAETDGMMFRPLAFDYPQDEDAALTEDQLMLGDACMIAPVYEQNARGRHVYLPEDMLLVRFRSPEDYDLVPMEKGHHWVKLALNEFLLFIRRGCVIPMAKAAEYVEGIDATALTLLGWLDGDAAITLYDDDGESEAIDLAAGLSTINVTVRDGHASAACAGKAIDASRIVLG